MYLGDYPVNGPVEFKWNSQGLDGASITLGTDGTLRLYKNGSLTQRTSSSGITFTEDFDGITGEHHLSILTSDNTDAGFYAAGNEYQVMLVGAVVDGKTVNTTLAHFSIERAGGALALLKAGSVAVASVATVSDKTGYRLSSTGVDDILRTALPESYAADGAAATLTQLLYLIQQLMAEKSIASTTMTVKKLDGSTTAATFTLNSATAPTAITRAT